MLKSIKKIVAVVATTVVTAPAFAEGETGASAIFAAVDLSSVTNFVTTTGVVVVGIALAMKGITLAKRALNKA